MGGEQNQLEGAGGKRRGGAEERGSGGEGKQIRTKYNAVYV